MMAYFRESGQQDYLQILSRSIIIIVIIIIIIRQTTVNELLLCKESGQNKGAKNYQILLLLFIFIFRRVYLRRIYISVRRKLRGESGFRVRKFISHRCTIWTEHLPDLKLLRRSQRNHNVGFSNFKIY